MKIKRGESYGVLKSTYWEWRYWYPLPQGVKENYLTVSYKVKLYKEEVGSDKHEVLCDWKSKGKQTFNSLIRSLIHQQVKCDRKYRRLFKKIKRMGGMIEETENLLFGR